MAVAKRGPVVRARPAISEVLAHRRTFAIALGVACLLPLALTLPFANEPLSRDEGVYATIAHGIVHGQVPYRDLFDHKPPLVYVWYALSFAVFGETQVAPRIAGALCLSATTLLLFSAARDLYNRRVALTAATLFALSTGFAVLDAGKNTEPFMLLPMVGSLATYARAKVSGRQRWYFFTGLLAGLATFTKPVAIVNLAVLAALSVSARRHEPGAWLREVGLMAAGSLVVAAAAVAPFLVTGTLGDFVYANVRYNQLYEAAISTHDKVALFVNNGFACLLASLPLVVLAVASLASMRWKRRSPGDSVVVWWLLASIAGVAAAGRFYGHYFIELLPALALAAATLAEAHHPVFSHRAFRVPILTLAASTVVTCVIWTAPLFEAAGGGSVTLKDASVAGERAVEAPSVGAAVAARTASNDRIFVWGRESEVYFYAGRPPATPFLFDMPFELDPGLFDEAMADLRADPPALIIDTMDGTEGLDPAMYDPQPYRAIINEFYEYDGRVGFASLYRRKS